MELTNEFTVGVPVGEAWKVLTDLERIAPCMPGAQLQEVEGDEYRGVVKIKVGPITAQYKGVATFQEKDDANHKAVLRAEGRDTRGQGNASATITATLVPDGDGTKVSVLTDLTITGKVAQFGRGVLGDVSAKLMDQFAAALDAEVLSGGASSSDAPAADLSGNGSAASSSASSEPSSTDAPEAPTGPRKIESRPVEPINVGAMAPAILKRYASGIGATMVVVLWLMRRRRKKKHS
ncbi:MAG: SRPBCC family protein [Acidobacteria bacterium]|nr:SRPBCC family protein [Acidobacteriota bacterium]